MSHPHYVERGRRPVFTLSRNEFICALTLISSSETKTLPVGVVTELVEGAVYHRGR